MIPDPGLVFGGPWISFSTGSRSGLALYSADEDWWPVMSRQKIGRFHYAQFFAVWGEHGMSTACTCFVVLSCLVVDSGSMKPGCRMCRKCLFILSRGPARDVYSISSHCMNNSTQSPAPPPHSQSCPMLAVVEVGILPFLQMRTCSNLCRSRHSGRRLAHQDW